MIVTTCSVLGSGFSRKEIIFVNISWLPKATIQVSGNVLTKSILGICTIREQCIVFSNAMFFFFNKINIIFSIINKIPQTLDIQSTIIIII